MDVICVPAVRSLHSMWCLHRCVVYKNNLGRGYLPRGHGCTAEIVFPQVAPVGQRPTVEVEKAVVLVQQVQLLSLE